MKFIYTTLIIAFSAIGCHYLSGEKRYIIHIELEKHAIYGIKIDTTYIWEKSDSAAYSNGYFTFLFTKKWYGTDNKIGTGLPRSFWVTDENNYRIKSRLSKSTIDSIEAQVIRDLKIIEEYDSVN